jgi:hypothetical protein
VKEIRSGLLGIPQDWNFGCGAELKMRDVCGESVKTVEYMRGVWVISAGCDMDPGDDGIENREWEWE